MSEEAKEIIPLGKGTEKQPIARYRVKLKDTPENRERVGRLVERLTLAITAGKQNIGFGVGLRKNNIVIEADDLNLIPPEMRKRRKRS